MHKSLLPKTSYGTAALCLLLLIAAVAYAGKSLGFWPIGFAVAGAVAGSLQARAVRSNPQAFLATESWAAVRSLMLACTSGKVSLGLILLNGVALLLLMLLAQPQPSMPSVLACYAGFMLARELVAVRALHWLKAQAAQSSAA